MTGQKCQRVSRGSIVLSRFAGMGVEWGVRRHGFWPGGGEISKSECRNPKEIRISKAEIGQKQPRDFRDFQHEQANSRFPPLRGLRCLVFNVFVWFVFFVVGNASAAVPASITTNAAGALVLAANFGDVNSDGKADVLDLVLVTRHLMDEQLLSATVTNRADLDLNGVINAADREILANIIARRLVGAGEDFDEDELSNAGEFLAGTNPLDLDSDRDGSLDGWEVVEGTNPLDPASKLQMTIVAYPPVKVISPMLQNEDTNTLGVVLASPPVKVISPLLQNEDTNTLGVVMAYPPVLVSLPTPASVVEAGATTVARPPVQVFFLAPAPVEETGGTTVAKPPVQLFFLAPPQVEEAGGTTVAKPPVKVVKP